MDAIMGMLWGIIASAALGFDLAWGIVGGFLIGSVWENFFGDKKKDED